MKLESISLEISSNKNGIPVGKITFADGRELIYEGHGTRFYMTFPCNNNELRDEMEDSSDEYEELHSAMFSYMMKMIPAKRR